MPNFLETGPSIAEIIAINRIFKMAADAIFRESASFKPLSLKMW